MLVYLNTFSFLGPIILATILLHMTLGPMFLYKKYFWKSQDQVMPMNSDDQEGAYNTSKSNDDLANGFINVAFGLCLLAAFPIVVLVDWQHELVIPTLLGHVAPIFLGNFMVPVKMIASNPKIRRHVKSLFSQRLCNFPC